MSSPLATADLGGGTLSACVRANCGELAHQLTIAQLTLAVRLLAAGAGHVAAAVCIGWLSGEPLSAKQVQDFDRVLRHSTPELAAYFADPWLALVAKFVGWNTEDLAKLLGMDDPDEGSFLRLFAATEFAGQLDRPDGWQNKFPEQFNQLVARRSTTRTTSSTPTLTAPLHTVADWWRREYRERFLSLTGEVIICDQHPARAILCHRKRSIGRC